MPLLSPQFNRVIDAAQRFSQGEATSQELEVAIQDAKVFFEQGSQLFERITPAILRSPQIDETLQHCREDIAAQDQALSLIEESYQRLSREGVANAAKALDAAALRLAEDYHCLAQLERQEKIYSPFAAIDHFIKTGLNVLEGHAQPQDLINRFPPVVSLTERTTRDITRFSAIYSEPAITSLMDKLVPNLNAGLGACLQYFRTGWKPALADGLKLLGRGSTAVHSGLMEMDRVIIAKRESKHAYLDELRRSQTVLAQGKLSWQHVMDAFSLVTLALDNYRNELKAFGRFPLRPFLKEEEQAALQAIEACEQALKSFEVGLQRHIPQDTRYLEPFFDDLVIKINALWDGIDREIKRYSTAPHFQELRERVGRALLGEPIGAMLKQPLEHFNHLQQQLSQEVAANLSPDTARELAAILDSQDQAYQVMLKATELDDLEMLKQGWQVIEETMPLIMDIAGEMRLALEAVRSETPSGVTCMRCSTTNAAGSRYCCKCNAMLMEIATAPTEYTDITDPNAGSQPGKTGPTRIALLESMISQLQTEGIDNEQVMQQVQELQQLVQAIATTYAQHTANRLNEQEAEFGQYFEEQIQHYFEGLSWIQKCLEDNEMRDIQHGLDLCLAAQDNLAAMSEQIKDMHLEE